jgi:hypothetical protein
MDSFARKADFFGASFQINFRGQTSVTSKVGLLATLMTAGLGMAFAVTQAMTLFQRTNVQINQYVEGSDLFQNTNEYSLSEYNFTIAFTVYDTTKMNVEQPNLNMLDV